MRGKRDKSAALRFSSDLFGNIFRLSERLVYRVYRMGSYNEFKVYEPKERDVLSISFDDKVVLHSLCDNILAPLFCKGFILDNYANQKGKGLHTGIKRLEFFMRSYYLQNKGRKEAECRAQNLRMPRIKDYNYHEGWIVKGDVRKFFYSIDHGILLTMIIKKLATLENKKDAAFAFWLCDQIIHSTPNPGIPIGNQTSQLFALLYLDGFDHFVKQDLGVKFYGRYMDDFFLIVRTKEEASVCLKRIRAYLAGIKLELNEKTNIFPLSHGIDFLGFHTYLTQTGNIVRKIRRKSKLNMKRKIYKFRWLVDTGKITLNDVKISYKSWTGHLCHADTFRLRESMNKIFYSVFPELKINPKDKETKHVATFRKFTA
jgi:hypothetical protein